MMMMTTRPVWWTDAMDTSWSAVKDEVLASWDRVVGVEKHLTPLGAEQALALGYNARKAFPAVDSWHGEIETMLRNGWNEAATGEPWEQVAVAAQHAWEIAPPRRALGATLIPDRNRPQPWDHLLAGPKAD